jgi:hypothetical protein
LLELEIISLLMDASLSLSLMIDHMRMWTSLDHMMSFCSLVDALQHSLIPYSTLFLFRLLIHFYHLWIHVGLGNLICV